MWFLETDGNCETLGRRWDLSKLAIPPFKVMSFWTLISDVVCEPDLGSQGYVLRRKCSSWYPWVVRREGNPQKRKPSHCKHVCLVGWLIDCLFVCFTGCLHILPCMFSLTFHLNLHHFDCLSADVISPLLLFSKASLWQIIVVAEECFHWPPMWTCTVLLASLLTLASYCRCFMQLLCDRSTTASTDIKLGKSWGEF